MQVYDACVKALTDHGLIVIPNCHLLDHGWCCTDKDTNGLWFNDRFEVAMFTAAWQEHRQALRRQPSGRGHGPEERAAAGDAGRGPPRAEVGRRIQTDLAREYPAWAT